MRLITRSALKRLAVFFILLALFVAGCWWNMILMPSRSFRGALPALSAEQSVLRDEIRRHVEKLAGEIGERNAGFKPLSLAAAADYIAAVFTNASHIVERQSFTVEGENCQNLIVEVRGTIKPDEIVIVGAHYDSVVGSPGADDNASGTAALLALARFSSLRQPARTLRFVAFSNEEPPYFQTPQMGSLVYANRCRQRGDHITAMICLESIGYYSSARGSQKYPFPVGLFYPSRGNFIGFVSRTADAALVHRCIRVFRERAPFPSEGGALPAGLPGVDWSDHWSFWQAGYPAIMVTDTATFRSPYYHEDNDTPDKLDYGSFARVVDGIGKVIEDLVAN